MNLQQRKTQQETYKSFMIYKVIHEMLFDREYSIPNNLTFSAFQDTFCSDYVKVPQKSELTFISYKNKKPTLIYFIEDSSVGIKHMMKIYDIMCDNNISHCIVVYPISITFSVKRYIQTKIKEIQVEFFSEDELIINKTKHILSPKYNLATDTDLKVYKIEDTSKLPKILYNDHISKYFGLKRGDILKINRKSETMGEYITFRICT